MKAQYWTVQYIDDIFRNEPRNIGVIVRIGDEIDARFVGETGTGDIDGRRLKLFKYPEVYREWHHYWRRMIKRGSMDKLIRQTESNFRVSQGGLVTDIGTDGTDAVVNYLYSLLISEKGFSEALKEEEDNRQDESEKPLENEVLNIFLERGLVSDSSEPDLFIKSPIRRNSIVEGSSCKIHRPAFVQENGRLYVMETADFAASRKRRQRDHAGLVAYMFKDIRLRLPDAEAIALVRVREADLTNDDVDYGLQLLKAEARIVDWHNRSQRDKFLEEREEVARR